MCMIKECTNPTTHFFMGNCQIIQMCDECYNRLVMKPENENKIVYIPPPEICVPVIDDSHIMTLQESTKRKND